MKTADNLIEVVSNKTDMDFVILVGQILDEFVKMNTHLKNIENRLGEIEDQLSEIADR